ncbi:DALR anticodon-binding domain-containing protein 3 [Coccinella septempunctata]|uniref:DALR anticodon-binding domain-containing protein 3 n=1 Tax=Coccinella septempunctata TaxID=41139 RepID=UPI001D068E89|nr:DALR anticodon-binding domain-containing protein 3 [Coccinella septempunctata]
MEVETSNMYFVDNIVNDICESLHVPRLKNNIIRIHTKKIEQLGEISFPLKMKNWPDIIEHKNENLSTVSDSEIIEQSSQNTSEVDLQLSVGDLKCESEKWCLPLTDVRIIKDNIHLYFRRQRAFQETIQSCFSMERNYGAIQDCPKYSLHIYDEKYSLSQYTEIDLTYLRMIILKKVIQNLIDFKLQHCSDSQSIKLYLSNKRYSDTSILCGYVINGNGKKDSILSAEELFRKRSVDMRLMAEHKYGLRKQSSQLWDEYFEKLGKASVTIELLQNKPHKNVRVSLNDLSCANKGASFIFYNCARLSTLFKEFERRVADGIYPPLSPIHNIDFSLLNQPEEWELLFVYIMQFPLLIRSCVRDAGKGIVNPHYLVSFLSSMCSVFSVYYRRIRILVTPKPHLIPTLNARIHLLRSLEQIFHKTLELLGIDPIEEM